MIPGWFKAFWYLDRLSPSLTLRLSEALHARARSQLTSEMLSFLA